MKILQGTITSLASAQTARVKVVRSWQHPLYQKFVKRSKNYACHYENMDLKIGDAVTIEETRPISKTKHFKVVSLVESQK
jgi:small subunit ribosomal protein S17